MDVTTCDILAKPESFDGKIVRVKGTVSAGFDEFVLKDATCNQPINAIWLAYPEGTKGKAGPAAFVQLQLARNSPAATSNANRSPIKIDKNKEFKQFDSLLSTPYKSGGMCLGCTRYTVTATLVGRLDSVKEAGITRDSAGKFVNVNGFGNLNLYRARLVLQTVTDVSSKEIDYSKVSSVTKNDSVRESASGDPVAAAHQAAKAFGPDSQAGKEVERAAAAFGKEGEDNGVEVGFGNPNELPKNDGLKGDKDSPDGVLFNCTFDMDRLKGDALATGHSSCRHTYRRPARSSAVTSLRPRISSMADYSLGCCRVSAEDINSARRIFVVELRLAGCTAEQANRRGDHELSYRLGRPEKMRAGIAIPAG
jgi:hypothetical protein